jgi:hypothetical protein
MGNLVSIEQLFVNRQSLLFAEIYIQHFIRLFVAEIVNLFLD